MGTDNKDNLHCSFCGKAQKEVKKLIAGPTVYICNECVDLCNEIIDDEDVKDIESELEEEIPKPFEIRDHLDSYVKVRQHLRARARRCGRPGHVDLARAARGRLGHRRVEHELRGVL